MCRVRPCGLADYIAAPGASQRAVLNRACAAGHMQVMVVVNENATAVHVPALPRIGSFTQGAPGACLQHDDQNHALACKEGCGGSATRCNQKQTQRMEEDHSPAP